MKLILKLILGCIIFSTLVDTNGKSNFNSSVQSVVTLNGGAQDNSSQSIPQALQQTVKVSKDSSSSISKSKSKTDRPTPQPGNTIRYFPNENPGGSGSSNNGPKIGEWEREWEAKASCPNPNEIISDIDFWNSYLDSKDQCPNIDVELDEDDDWSFKDIVEIPDEVLPQRRRRLLATQPTADLDKSVKSKHTYSNSAIKPFSFHSKEGIILTIKNKELEKIVYAHSDDLNLLNFADRVICPVQTDPIKFQRTECRAVTDSAKKEALIRILELTTSTNSDFLTRRFPMPSYSSQDALAYIDKTTNACLFFHADGGHLWSAKKLSQDELDAILSNQEYKNLN